MVDRGLVLRKLSELDTYLNQVREYAALKVSQYRKDWRTQRIVERTLQIMIEECVDIAGHIISDQKLRVPASYADSFRVLHEHGILKEDLCRRLEKMSKFRNLLVHHYDKIDPEIIIGILKKGLMDFEKFKKSILVFLEKQKTI